MSIVRLALAFVLIGLSLISAAPKAQTPNPTTTNLVSSLNPSSEGQTVTFTATVAGNGTPTSGFMTFMDGSTTLYTVGVLSGQASYTTGGLTSGTHFITATFGGATGFAGSTSNTVTQTVNASSLLASSTSLSSDVQSSYIGQLVTFTARVTSTSGKPTGTVTFTDGTTSTTLGTGSVSSGLAQVSTSSLAGFCHSITATYSGDSNFAGSTSSPFLQCVSKGTTTTGLTSSPNPSGFGQAVTFTATVQRSSGTGSPTGSVTFSDGTTILDTRSMTSGTASLTTSSLSSGSHSIYASYSGDTNFATSSAAAVTQVVNAPTTTASTTSLGSSLNPSTFGQAVTFTATVSGTGGSPTGMVSFVDGSTTLGTGNLVSGSASFTSSALAVGGHAITAAYGGDSSYSASTSSALTQNVSKATATVGVTSSLNPSTVGQAVTFTATVTGPGGTPTGTVAFKDGAATLSSAALSSGTASLTTSSLNFDSHSITVVYSGDGNFSAGTSSPLTQTVNLNSTSTTVSSSQNPSNSGQSVTFTAVVAGSGGTPTGTVTFKDGTATLGTGSLAAGSTSVTTTALTTGSHSITAIYGGDTAFQTSASLVLNQTVNKGSATTASTTTLTSSPNPASFGTSVTLTATVTGSGGTPSGSVTFQDGSTTIGNGTLAGGVASFATASLSAGSHSITAVYGGDSTFVSSASSALTQSVAQNASTVALASSPNPSTLDQTVTFTATVSGSGGNPSGTVTFKDGATSIGTGNLSAGTASFSTSSLMAGSHSITAVYGGDTNFLASTSSAVTQTVNKSTGTAATTTALKSSPNPSQAGQSVTFTATVSGSGSIPTGMVTFNDGTSTLGTGSLTSGTATFSTASLAIGNHSITASYSGDGNFGASVSTALTQVVDQATSPGQTYAYQSTLGVTGSAAADNAHFDNPAAGIVDSVNGHLFVADTTNHRVQVVDTGTLAVVATIGTSGASGSDNGHLNNPEGVGFDAVNGRVFVADTGNQRIQVFDAKTFGHVASIGVTGTPGTDNAHFKQPASAFFNQTAGQLYVADSGNQRVQIFDGAALTYLATLGTTGVSGADNAHFSQPSDAELDPTTNHILVADGGNARVQVFDAASFGYVTSLGVTGEVGGDSSHFALPTSASFDPGSDLVLVADGGANARVQAFDAMTYRYVETLGGNGQFAGPRGLAVDTAHSHAFVGDGPNDRVQIYAIAPVATVASTLPGSRSVQVGHPATIFASVINSGTASLDDCQISLPVTAPSSLTLSYQTTNPGTNALEGTPDTPVSITGGNGLQTFLVSLQSASPVTAPGLALDFGCAGSAPAAVVTGVDTVDLSVSATPVADIIALSATATNNGVAELPSGGAGAFAVASTNVGATSSIIVSVDTGTATLPLTAAICQSDPTTGQCVGTPSASVSLSYAAGAAPTFSVFLQANRPIAFAPASSRVFVRFRDASGSLHGSTSVAVETQ